MALPYPTKVVLPFDIATAQDMNERHANDVALAAGTGLDDGAVGTPKIANGAVTVDKRAGGFKVGTIATSVFGSTGAKTITGVGFTPKLIEIYTGYDVSASGAARECFGFTDGVTSYCRGSAISGSSQARWSVTGAIVNIRNELNSSVLTVTFGAFNSDGFTLNVTTADASYSAVYIAYA